MASISSTDLTLLSFMGVGGRAFAKLLETSDLNELLAASSLRARKPLGEAELVRKQADSERYRQPLIEFERRGGHILGSKGISELGSLMRAPTPPLCAYLRGDPTLLQAQTKVAIVGTRHPSERGVARARELAAHLSQAGVLVISGGAMGIDLAAHEGALSQDFATLAVLGEPLKPLGDERPSRLRALKPSEKLSSMTVFGPWVNASKSLFVMRNQYVAALADAVVIIEARPNSGTLHTARYAQQMRVPVWVVPGDPGDEMSQTNNSLLEQGLARALVRVEYFLGTLGRNNEAGPFISTQKPLIDSAPCVRKAVLSVAQEQMVALFRQNKGRLTIDELMEKCEAQVSALQQELLMLELLGAIKKQGTEFVLV